MSASSTEAVPAGTPRRPAGVGEIIDPFVVLNLGADVVDVPMPKEALRDEESRNHWPANDMVGHLFRKDEASRERARDAGDLGRFLAALDSAGVDRAGVPLPLHGSEEVLDRVAELGGRVFVSLRIDPHEGLRGLRRAQRLCETYPFIRAFSLTPFQIYPFMAPNSKEYYPVYAKAAELNRPVFVNVGFPGPRVPAWTQDPIALDEVCWFFPELTVVLRHGGLPWVDVCVQMLLRWPNLYYATTAMAPKYYPSQILDLVNSRAPNKILFAGYWPMLSYERIFRELYALPVREQAWPALLAGNARTAFRLPADGAGDG